MTTANEGPDNLWGILQPGESTTRKFSCALGSGHAAVLQRVPHSGIRIVEQTADRIVLENTGPAPSPYLVLFPAKELVNALLGAKEVVTYLAGMRGKR